MVVAAVEGGGRVAVGEAWGAAVVPGEGGVGLVRVVGGVGGLVRVVAVGVGGRPGRGWGEGGRRGGEGATVGALRAEWFLVGLLGL